MDTPEAALGSPVATWAVPLRCRLKRRGRSVGPLLDRATTVAGGQEDAVARQLRREMPGQPHGQWTAGPELLRGRAREGVVVPAFLPGSKALDERTRHPESHQLLGTDVADSLAVGAVPDRHVRHVLGEQRQP